MGGGCRVLVPLKRESSLLGLLILERGTVFSGSEISHIKSRLESITSDISDYLVINTVMINSATGLYSKAYYEVKYNELLRRHNAEGTDFSVLFISFFEETLSLSEEQRTSLFRIVAPTIKEYLNNSDTLCLYNDMIAIILPFTDSGKTGILADELSGTLSRYRIKIDSGHMVTMKPACGYASTDSAPSPQGLTDLALLRLQRFRQGPAAHEVKEAIAISEPSSESVPDVIPLRQKPPSNRRRSPI
jgi:GGDEF domain-containing protein